MGVLELQSVVLTAIALPIAVYFTKYWWDRRRWKTFAQGIESFAHENFVDNLTRDDLRALVAAKLSDAGFEPDRVNELLPVGLWFALGRISVVCGGRIPGNLAGPIKEHPPDDGD